MNFTDITEIDNHQYSWARAHYSTAASWLVRFYLCLGSSVTQQSAEWQTSSLPCARGMHYQLRTLTVPRCASTVQLIKENHVKIDEGVKSTASSKIKENWEKKAECLLTLAAQPSKKYQQEATLTNLQCNPFDFCAENRNFGKRNIKLSDKDYN